MAEWVDNLDQLYNTGLTTGAKFGLNALDALHIAAALMANCDDFITAEKPTSPFSRVSGVNILTIY